MQEFFPGQRCISDTESELGLGTIMRVDARHLEILFLATGEMRTYAVNNAPLTRITFTAGDRIQSHKDWYLLVEHVEQGRDGLFTYYGQKEDGTQAVLKEGELNNFIQFNQPKERLLAGQFDRNKWFNLRASCLSHSEHLYRSDYYGISGIRAELLPHQLYIANEISKRDKPRVLLADEVGLGKTIEAGIIMHRMLLQERIKRVLIVVPNALLHQWLVEMLRRFNLSFSIMDEMRCAALQEDMPDCNPFQSEQLVLCSSQFIAHSAHRQQEILQCEWDLLVVDEAHHLEWTPEQSSPSYDLVEALAQIAPSVLLLTATPEQLGVSGHFARLRLLDPERFHSLEQFIEDEKRYQHIADTAMPLLSDTPLTADTKDALVELLNDEDSQSLLDQAELDEPQRRRLISRLVDRHGTGRILYRNTRANISGFPERQLIPHAFEATLDITQEDAEWWRQDARVTWLIEALKENYPERFLLICRSADTALDLAEALRVRAGISAAVFHEGMSIVERDRAAAFFADEELGAPILLCSEIGSEGRNFQFVHNLVLFELPFNPDLLEQRIGRLDRIGQKHTVNIHVPYFKDSDDEILLRWYHEGLNAFEQTCNIGANILKQQGKRLLAILENPLANKDVEPLIEESKQLATEMRETLEQGRDRLLEMNSCHPDEGRHIVETIQAESDAHNPWLFFEQVADCFGMDIEQLADDRWAVRPGSHMQIQDFPGLPQEGTSVTLYRETALAREDVQFLTWEHPIIKGGLEMLTSSEQGKVAIGALKSQAFPAGEILIESLFTLTCPAPVKLGYQRYLPGTNFRYLHTSRMQELAAKVPATWLSARVQNIKGSIARQLVQQQQAMLVEKLGLIEDKAGVNVEALRAEAQKMMHDELDSELTRLQVLQAANPNLPDEEITALTARIDALDEALGKLQLRFDAVRIIFTH